MSLTLLSLLRGAGRAVPSVSQGLGGAAGGIIAPRFALATRNACSPPSSSSGEDGEDSQVGQPIPINYKKVSTVPIVGAGGVVDAVSRGHGRKGFKLETPANANTQMRTDRHTHRQAHTRFECFEALSLTLHSSIASFSF